MNVHQKLTAEKALKQARQFTSEHCRTVWILFKDGFFHCTACENIKNARLADGYDLATTVNPEDAR
jgi:hypothetical protein